MMMTMIRLRSLFLVLFSVLPLFLFAQREDFQMRIGAAMDGKLSNQFDWNFGVEQRLRNNASMYDQFQVEPGVSYNPYDFLKIGVGYRYAYRLSRKQEFQSRHRAHIDVRLRQKADRWTFKYRTRLQYGFENFTSQELLGTNALIQRHSLGVDYDIFGSRFKPFVSGEIYHHLNKPGGSMITKTRFSLGTAYRLSFHSVVELSYLINKEVNIANPTTEYILGISYAYSF